MVVLAWVVAAERFSRAGLPVRFFVMTVHFSGSLHVGFIRMVIIVGGCFNRLLVTMVGSRRCRPVVVSLL